MLYVAVLVAGGRESADALTATGEAVHYAAGAFRHAKPVGALGEGVDLLRRAPMSRAAPADNGDTEVASEAGVVTLGRATAPAGGDGLNAFASAFADAIAAHRHYERELASVPA